MTDDVSAIHVGLIAEIAHLLTGEDIPFWLFGGWAVDFAVGRVTRSHRDIEFVVWRHDSDLVTQLLATRGYTLHARADEVVTVIKQGIDAEFYVLVRDGHGHIITPGRWARWPWLPGSFDGDVGRIGDVTCPIVSIETPTTAPSGAGHDSPGPSVTAGRPSTAPTVSSRLQDAGSASSATARPNRATAAPHLTPLRLNELFWATPIPHSSYR